MGERPLSQEEFARVVNARYSCYTFDPNKEVDEAALKACIELTKQAPRVKNTQPWTAIVVRSLEAKAKLITAMDKIHQAKVHAAPVSVVFAAETDQEKVLMKKTPDFIKDALPSMIGESAEAWAFKQTSFAAAVFMLACTSHNIQTCAMERFASSTSVAEALGLPDNFSVPLVVAVGHELEAKKPGENFSNNQARIYLDGFGTDSMYWTQPGGPPPGALQTPTPGYAAPKSPGRPHAPLEGGKNDLRIPGAPPKRPGSAPAASPKGKDGAKAPPESPKPPASPKASTRATEPRAATGRPPPSPKAGSRHPPRAGTGKKPGEEN